MPNKDNVMKQWDDAAEVWVDFVRKGKDFHRDELNNPATFKLIGDVKGQFVLDLACGEGYNTRMLARKGARVIGVDFSEKLVQLAKDKEAEDKLGIRYHITDAADLSMFPCRRFNLVTCFMALQDIRDYKSAVAEVARILKKGGRFVFSITHPCFEMVSHKGFRVSTNERYFEAAEDNVQWRMERLLKPFETTSFHRTLTDYSCVLNECGFVVRRLVEPKPTVRGIEKHESLKKVLLRPESMVFEAVKEG